MHSLPEPQLQSYSCTGVLRPVDKRKQASIALIVVLIACTIAVIAFVMGNGTTPIGPPTPVPGSGGSVIEGWNRLTPVVPTVAVINCENATITCSDGGSGILNLAVVTPTPQPIADSWPQVGFAEIPQSSQWIDGCIVNCNYSTVARANNILYLNPIVVGADVSISAIGVRVQSSVGAGTARIGLYAGSGTGNLPDGAPVIDEGTIDCTATGSYTFTLGSPITMSGSEIYWTAFHGDCVNVAIYAITNGTALKINDTTNNRDNNGVQNLVLASTYSAVSLPTLNNETFTRSNTIQSRIRLEID